MKLTQKTKDDKMKTEKIYATCKIVNLVKFVKIDGLDYIKLPVVAMKQMNGFKYKKLYISEILISKNQCAIYVYNNISNGQELIKKLI